MAAIRDIVTHVVIEVAGKARICHRNRKNHNIAKGQKSLAIYDDSGGRKNYCLPCAMEILNAAKVKLAAMEQEIQA